MATVTETWPELMSYYPAWLRYRRWFERIPGVQLAVRRQGTLLVDRAFGVSNADTSEPLTCEHLFRIASHSKTLTSVLLLRLVEQGRLRLDDTVAQHVAELADSPIGDRMVGELLSHSGGVTRDSEDGDFWQLYRPFPDRIELIDVASTSSAATLPRNEHFKYSNIGYGLLGLIIEAVTGESFAQRVHEEIAVPLALNNLGGELDAARAADYAAGHSGLATKRDRTVIEHVDTRELAAATGCYANAGDLSALFSALLPGDHTLLSADSQRLQRRQHWRIGPGERGYGLGVFLDRIGEHDLFGHTGGYPGHTTCTLVDADDGWVVSVLTNAIDGAASELATQFFALQGLARKAEHAHSPDDAVRFTGRFASAWGVLDVIRLDGRLFAVDPTSSDPAEEAAGLEVVDESTLRIAGGRGGNSYGELMRYEFADGEAVSLRGDSGMSMTPWVEPQQ